MIQISGAAHRSFDFPAPLPEAFAYYADIENSFRFLPHISVVQRDGSRFRLLYSALESGLYRVKIYCDVVVEINRAEYLIRIRPRSAPVRSEAGIYSMTGQGIYSSRAQFRTGSGGTRVEYSIEIQASLPVPVTLKWVPGTLMDGIAQNKFLLHTDEIVDSFVKRSMQAYRSSHG